MVGCFRARFGYIAEEGLATLFVGELDVEPGVGQQRRSQRQLAGGQQQRRAVPGGRGYRHGRGRGEVQGGLLRAQGANSATPG